MKRSTLLGPRTDRQGGETGTNTASSPNYCQAVPEEAQDNPEDPGAGSSGFGSIRPQDPLCLHEGGEWPT